MRSSCEHLGVRRCLLQVVLVEDTHHERILHTVCERWNHHTEGGRLRQRPIVKPQSVRRQDIHGVARLIVNEKVDVIAVRIVGLAEGHRNALVARNCGLNPLGGSGPSGSMVGRRADLGLFRIGERHFGVVVIQRRERADGKGVDPRHVLPTEAVDDTTRWRFSGHIELLATYCRLRSSQGLNAPEIVLGDLGFK